MAATGCSAIQWLPQAVVRYRSAADEQPRLHLTPGCELPEKVSRPLLASFLWKITLESQEGEAVYLPRICTAPLPVECGSHLMKLRPGLLHPVLGSLLVNDFNRVLSLPVVSLTTLPVLLAMKCCHISQDSKPSLGWVSIKSGFR